jgi:hypothetical protein
MTRVWISFKLNDRRLKAKTDTWEVWSLDEASHIGSVRWYSPWRKYCFFPSHETVWEQDCLRHIAEFIESETAKHRKGKRSFSREATCG